jgi:hypothetical protein
MPRRSKVVDVADLGDVDLLERVLARQDLDPYEVGVFTEMLGTLRRREEEYGDDAYGLTERQREWVGRAFSRERWKLTGAEFAEAVRDVIGRDLRLR